MSQVNERYRHHDMLTYRHPRNTIDAFGTDATSAYAGTRYRSRQLMLVRWLLRAAAVGWVCLMAIGIATTFP